jgi:superfamily II DNA or RNA helicase
MAFIRRSGIRPMMAALRKHTDPGRPLRVLTTTYTGSTEERALDELQQLGAEVFVSYDLTTTRLHAKAWLFHRASGFSTAYIGSSNLTHSAQISGLEWNVRVSGARNPDVIRQVSAMFEAYRNSGDFLPYDREQFRACAVAATSGPAVMLSPLQIRLEPFQERLLELIALSRQQGHHRNLLVSATGTGKTVMAAVDYGRLSKTLQRSRLLFVAHREEILTQTIGTFRHGLRDPAFGELWVGGARPNRFDHVFASIQSLNASGFASLDPKHFDVVIVDEFHHAEAPSYRTLLDHVKPTELLGLTATPERSDGLPILHWFDDRIAAELRVWDAIDQGYLSPFAYYGIHDGKDFRNLEWTRGGYREGDLTNLFTANDVWANQVIASLSERVEVRGVMRALGFCVSVAHARFMARVFNEGVDVPVVDTLLLLRPTDSPTLFLQQLGRGLRRSEGKTVCTVLDFVGHHRKEFRFDRRFGALLGGTRKELEQRIREGFPFLPAGCHMELDPIASEIVLRSIREAVPSTWPAKVAELRRIAQGRESVSLAHYLEESGSDLDDVYSNGRSWSDLRDAAGLPQQPSGPEEQNLRRACGRLLHLDDMERIDGYRRLLASPSSPPPSLQEVIEKRPPKQSRGAAAGFGESLESTNEFVVFRVRADPKPLNPVGHIVSEGAIPVAHSDRPDLSDALEVQGSVSRIGLQELEVLVCDGPDPGRQGFVERPEPERRPVLQRARLLPALCSFIDSLARPSRRPAAESRAICPSQARASNSRNHERSLASSSGDRLSIRRSICSTSLMLSLISIEIIVLQAISHPNGRDVQMGSVYNPNSTATPK